MKQHLGWIVPVVLIVALAWTVRAYAGAMGRADAEADRSAELVLERDSIADSVADLTDELAAADSAAAVQAQADSVVIAELDQENEELGDELRDLVLQDARAAEDVDVALRDLGAVLSQEAMPALRELQAAYRTRFLGLTSQIATQQELIDNKDVEIALLGSQLGTERTNRSAADVLTAGLRTQIVTLDAITASKDIEIAALRSAVAPSFFNRIFQNIGLVAGTAAVTAVVVIALTR